MKNARILKSKCCNCDVSQQVYTTLEMIMNNIHPFYTCQNCRQTCAIEPVPAFEEISKGIFRPINR